jgi:hypothetical protein
MADTRNDSSDEPVTTDDVEGHRFVPVEERPTVGNTPAAAADSSDKDDDEDDTEGHRATQ